MSRYDATWVSLQDHAIPGWFEDAKLGVYAHWGPYSVPGQGAWYTRHMYREGSEQFEHHRGEWGPQEEFGYKEFVPMFEAENFDADEWARVCADAGADYVGITATHCDGFLMWDSDISRWNAAEMGPERDIVGELAEAVRDHGMKFLASFHHDHSWWWYPHDDRWDTGDPEYADLYGEPHDGDAPPSEAYFQDWRDKIIEVVDAYRPDLLWFDNGLGTDWFLHHDEYRREVVAHYYNRAEEWGKEVDVCHKQHLPRGVGIVDHERSRETEIKQRPWMTDIPIGERWAYVPDDEFKSETTLITGLVDRASKNGSTLLDVGPKPDGTFPEEAVDRLRAIGDWQETHGEPVAGSRPSWTFGEGPTEIESTDMGAPSEVTYTAGDVRFLGKGSTLYAVLLAWPDDEMTIETPLGSHLSSSSGGGLGSLTGPREVGRDDYRVALAATGEELDWDPVDDGVRVKLPSDPPSPDVNVLRIELAD